MKKYHECSSFEKFVIDTWNVPIIRSWNDITENKEAYREVDTKLLYLRLGSGFFVAETENKLREATGIADNDTWNRHLKPLVKSMVFTHIKNSFLI